MINILISIIRSKFVAILLGPTGMGISGLLNSTVSIIQGFTNFGIGTSSIREIAAAQKEGDQSKSDSIINVSKRLMWLTGIFGTSITLLLSPWLSALTFGTSDYTVAFATLSIILLLNQLNQGHLAILQGMRKLQYLAKANILGSFSGVIVSVPLFYLFGLQAIVPAMILSSTGLLLISWKYTRLVDIERIKLTWTQFYASGKKLMSLGFLINLSGLIGLGSAYAVRIYIGRSGSIQDVGLYVAGYAMITKYAGIILNAMSKDYLPRLSSISFDNAVLREAVNKQKEILVLLITPLLIAFILFAHYIIIILYTDKFLSIVLMVQLISLGMFFKAISWSMGFLAIAKGDGKLYFWNSIAFACIELTINIAGYKYGGVTGLGISFVVNYFISTIHVYLICRIFYEYRFERATIILVFKQLVLVTVGFVSTQYLASPLNYIFGVIILIASLSYSYRELESRLNIKNLVMSKLKNRKIK